MEGLGFSPVIPGAPPSAGACRLTLRAMYLRTPQKSVKLRNMPLCLPNHLKMAGNRDNHSFYGLQDVNLSAGHIAKDGCWLPVRWPCAKLLQNPPHDNDASLFSFRDHRYRQQKCAGPDPAPADNGRTGLIRNV